MSPTFWGSQIVTSGANKFLMNFQFALSNRFIFKHSFRIQKLLYFFLRSKINMDPFILVTLPSRPHDNENERRLFKSKLKIEYKRRRDRRIPRIALQSHSCSAFNVLLVSGSDQPLITITVLDHRAFRHLLS